MLTDTTHNADPSDKPSSVPLTREGAVATTGAIHEARMDAAERCLNRRQLRNWKLGTICALGLLLGYIFYSFSDNVGGSSVAGGAYIARIKAEGVIMADSERDKRLKELEENENVKAVLLHIDSPGGTLTGGEDWYNSLRAISAKKPVVAVVNSMAASGGYMAALGTDRIFVREGSIVGSIGVIYQSANINKLAENMGIKVLSYASGDLKAQPSPVAEITPGAKKMIMDMITDVQQMFLRMAKERRGLKPDVVTLISDGRIVSGKRAIEINLADVIGTEHDAVTWLDENHDIDAALDIRDVKLYKNKNIFERKFGSMIPNWLSGATTRATMPSGLMAIHPF